MIKHFSQNLIKFTDDKTDFYSRLFKTGRKWLELL